MADVTDAAGIWIAKLGGAIAGSAISIAYLLPVDRREAAIRFAVGIVCGIVFGTTVGVKIGAELGVLAYLSTQEVALMGSAFTSLCAWGAVGFLQRSLVEGSIWRFFSRIKK